jgi:hypothetical protein
MATAGSSAGHKPAVITGSAAAAAAEQQNTVIIDANFVPFLVAFTAQPGCGGNASSAKRSLP